MLLSLPLALALLARSPAPSGPAGDTCPPPASADTVTAAVVATLVPVDRPDALPPGYAAQFLREVAHRLALPNPLVLVPYRAIGPRPKPLNAPSPDSMRALARRGTPYDLPRVLRPATHAFGLVLGVRLADGAESRATILAGSLTPAADSAVLAAVQRLIEEGLVTSLRGRPVDAQLLLRSVDSVGPSDVVFIRFRAPRATLLEASVQWAPAPHYPIGRRNRRQPGKVRIEFVVGTDGRVVPGSLRIVASTHRDFVEEVMKAAPNYRFRPASIGGCLVPQLVEMPFEFSIR